MKADHAVDLIGKLFSRYPSIYLDDEISAEWVKDLLPFDHVQAGRAIRKFTNEVTNRNQVNWANLRSYILAEVEADRRAREPGMPALPPSQDEPATAAGFRAIRERLERRGVELPDKGVRPDPKHAEHSDQVFCDEEADRIRREREEAEVELARLRAEGRLPAVPGEVDTETGDHREGS